MVVTSRMLQDRWGIQSEIANYFANERKVPEGNAFWKNKRIYISRGFGFLIIPFYFDLLNRAGVLLEDLLNDEQVSLLEKGIDYSMRYENGEYSLEKFLQKCKTLLEGNIRNRKLAADIFNFLSGRKTDFFSFKTDVRALNRSDGFLLLLASLDVSDEWIVSFIPYWHALIRPILFLDDIKDFENDKKNGDENAIIELGGGIQAISKAYNLVLKDLAILATINPIISKELEFYLNEAYNTEIAKKKIES